MLLCEKSLKIISADMTILILIYFLIFYYKSLINLITITRYFRDESGQIIMQLKLIIFSAMVLRIIVI